MVYSDTASYQHLLSTFWINPVANTNIPPSRRARPTPPKLNFNPYRVLVTQPPCNKAAQAVRKPRRFNPYPMRSNTNALTARPSSPVVVVRSLTPATSRSVPAPILIPATLPTPTPTTFAPYGSCAKASRLEVPPTVDVDLFSCLSFAAYNAEVAASRMDVDLMPFAEYALDGLIDNTSGDTFAQSALESEELEPLSNFPIPPSQLAFPDVHTDIHDTLDVRKFPEPQFQSTLEEYRQRVVVSQEARVEEPPLTLPEEEMFVTLILGGRLES